MNLINKRIKISFLDMNEHFLRSAEGVATSGSINIDGASALRRTSQLTFSTQDISAVDYFELYKTKFKLEVDIGFGYVSQGIYLLTSFSSNLTTNNFTFNISGKDKMCLLNGEHGGSFSSSVDFGKLDSINEIYIPIEKELYEPGKYYYQTQNENKLEYQIDYSMYPTTNRNYFKKELQYTQVKIPIKDIIMNLLVEYGDEKKENVFIYDLDMTGLELLEYRGLNPLYLYRNTQSGKIENLTIDGKQQVQIKSSNKMVSISTLGNGYYPLTPLGEEIDTSESIIITDGGMDYNIIKIEYGQSLGYRDTDLVYAGDLLGNINENIVSILDKIKNMLGNYEYFYNEKGHFIFRKRKDYIDNIFPSTIIDGLGLEYITSYKHDYYKLKQSEIISIQRTPQIMNIKNDFSIWGNRQGSNGQLPIHSRIAIHNKPDWYVNYNGVKFIYNPENFDSLWTEYYSCIEAMENLNITKKEIYENFINTIANEENTLFTDPVYREQYLNLFPDLCEFEFPGDKIDMVNDFTILRQTFYVALFLIGKICCLILNGFNNGDISYKINSEQELYLIDRKLEKVLKYLIDDLLEMFINPKKETKLKNYINQGSSFLRSIKLYLLEILGVSSSITDDQIKNYLYIKESLENEIKSYIYDFILHYIKYYYNDNNVLSIEDNYERVDNPFNNKDSILYKEYLNKNGNLFDKELSILINQLRDEVQKKNFSIAVGQPELEENYCYFKVDHSLQNYFSKLANMNQVEYDKDEFESDIYVYSKHLSFVYPYYYYYYDNQGRRLWDWHLPYYFDIQEEKVSSENAFQTQKENFINIYNEYYYNENTKIIYVNDWREIIYQMAKDYYNNHKKIDYWIKINEYNNNRYLKQITTYEPFYEDLLGFWRQLYYNPLYESLDYSLPDGYTVEDYDKENSWHKDVSENPSGLNFWFDFIVPTGDFQQFSINNIGAKGKYLNDSKVKSIANKKPPAIKILSSMDWELLGDNPDSSYSYIQLGGILKDSYTISSQSISALDKTQELLFTHTYAQETLNLSILPTDNIQVNTRIKLEGFDGEYTVSKITIPLQYNGAMNIVLTKIPPVLTTETIRKEFE